MSDVPAVLERNDLNLRDPAAYSHWATDTVRFSDQDSVGHVNNVAIATYVETGRLWFAHHVVGPDKAPGERFILARLEVDYLAESSWPGEVRIGCRILRLGNKSYTVGNGVFKDGRCIALGRSVIAHQQDGRGAPIVGTMRAKLEELLGA